MTSAEVGASLKLSKGRFSLVNGSQPIRGQIIALVSSESVDRATVLWASSTPFNSPTQFGGQVWPVVLAWAGSAFEPWTDQIQGSPPEAPPDRRSSAQKSADELARLAAIASNPLGGAYGIGASPNYSNPGVAFTNFAFFIGPASAIIAA